MVLTTLSPSPAALHVSEFPSPFTLPKKFVGQNRASHHCQILVENRETDRQTDIQTYKHAEAQKLQLELKK